MKGEKLIDALGKIDDRLVAGVMPMARERKRSPWPVIAAAAAVAAVCLFAFPRILRPPTNEMGFTPMTQETQSTAQSETVLDPFMVPVLPDEFPATTAEAVQMGVVLQPVEQRNLIPGTLPVYTRAGESPAPDYAAMKALARELAEKLEVKGEPEKYGKTVHLQDGNTIMVDSQMTAEITFETPLPLPLAYDLTTYDGACLAAAWIRANYLRDLDMEKPATTVTGSEESGWEIRVGDSAKADYWYQTDTGFLRFLLRDHGIEKIVLRSPEVFGQLGEYPIYAIHEARNRVMAGAGYCNLEQPPANPVFHAMGISYLEFASTDVSAPFYWFAATLEDGQEALWFLPAVQEHYLKVKYWWNDQNDGDIYDKLLRIPGFDEITEDTREAFADFMTEMKLVGDYVNYNMHFEVTGDVVLLHCQGPLMVTTGDIQVFQYDRKTGTVSWGASGVWEEEPFDSAQAIRRMLQERSGEYRYVGYDYSQCVREAFVLYFMEHPHLLTQLPAFDFNTKPDRAAVAEFILRSGQLNQTFTEQELDAAIDVLLEGVEFEHGPADQLTYENGVYAHLPYGPADGPVYYRPEMCSRKGDVWWMVLTGYEFWPEDFMEQAEEKSPNWQRFAVWSAENQDLREEALIQYFNAAVAECLYSNDITPEDIGLQPSQQLTVEFRLQDGDYPLQFVSCQRIVTCGE